MSLEYSELFKRNEGIFTDSEQKKLQKSKVLIIGTGGVGGTVALILARTGIENFILVDFDTYDISNTNRQIGCFEDTLGEFKADVIAKEIRRINESAQVTSIPKLCTLDEIDSLMKGCDAVMGGADDFAFSIYIEKMARQKGIFTLLVIPSGTWAHVVVTNKDSPSISSIEGIPETSNYEELRSIIHQTNFKHAQRVYIKRGWWLKEYFDQFIKGEVKPAQICPCVWLASSLGARELVFALAEKKATISPYYWEIHADKFIRKNVYFSRFSFSVLLRKIFLTTLLYKVRTKKTCRS